MAGVTRRFSGTYAVSGLDLEIPTGEIVGLIGPSGSGKTTTIRMITGSLGPTSGRVEVLGVAPNKFRRRTRERIGYVLDRGQRGDDADLEPGLLGDLA